MRLRKLTLFASASVSPPENVEQGEGANTDFSCNKFGDQWGEKDLTDAGVGIRCREISSPFLLPEAGTLHLPGCPAMPALPWGWRGVVFWGVQCRAISHSAAQRGLHFCKSWGEPRKSHFQTSCKLNQLINSSVKLYFKN